MSLRGTAIRQDEDGHELFYGQRLATRDIVLDGLAPDPRWPDSVAEWRVTLQRHARRARRW